MNFKGHRNWYYIFLTALRLRLQFIFFFKNGAVIRINAFWLKKNKSHIINTPSVSVNFRGYVRSKPARY